MWSPDLSSYLRFTIYNLKLTGDSCIKGTMNLVNTILVQTQGPVSSTPASNNDNGAILGWLVGFALATVAVVLVARPLTTVMEGGARRRLPRQTPAQEATRLQLENLQESATAERQSLQDLDFDHELGIMEEADYTEFKERSVLKLEKLEQQIGSLQHNLNGRSAEPIPTRTAAKNVATTVATRSAKTRTTDTEKLHLKAAIKEKLKCGECSTPFKPGDRFCRQCSAPLPILCLNCGKEVTENDRFCAKCGAAVNT